MFCFLTCPPASGFGCCRLNVIPNFLHLVQLQQKCINYKCRDESRRGISAYLVSATSSIRSTFASPCHGIVIRLSTPSSPEQRTNLHITDQGQTTERAASHS